MSQIRQSLLVARRELRDSLTDWRIVVPAALLSLIFPWLLMEVVRFGVRYIERYDPNLLMTRLIPFSVMIVGFFPISFSLVIALESFVGEKERNTLESLLSTPITDAALYVGKFLAALALPLMGSITAMVLYAVGLPWVTGLRVPPDLLAQVLSLTVTLALGMVSGAVVVSSNTTSVRAANLLASFIVIPAMMLVQFQAMVILWEQRHVLWYIALAQGLADLALIRMGIRLFNRDELLARTMDRIDLRRAWRVLKTFFLEEPASVATRRPSAPFSLGRLYRRDLPQLLRRNRSAIAAVALVVVAGLLVGWGYARAVPLSAAEAESLGATPQALRATVSGVFEGAGLSPLKIFWHNLRSLSLAAVVGVFCFGIASIAPMFATFGLLGFWGAEALTWGLGLGPIAAVFGPHGVLEIPAAFLATAAGLRMGAAVLAPPKGFSLGETLLLGLADFLKLMLLLVVPLLLVAAFVETYVMPWCALWALGG